MRVLIADDHTMVRESLVKVLEAGGDVEVVAQAADGIEAVEKAEHKRSDFGVGLETEPALKSTDVVQRLVDHRQADDGVDEIAVDTYVEVDAEQQRDGMAQREEAYVDADMRKPVQEEDHTEEKQDVVIAGQHVLGAEIDKRQQVDA